LVHLGVVVVFRLSDYAAQPNDLLISAAAGILNGGISASLALGGLFLIGPVFDVITTMRLIELSRPDHPLLQRLLREAPGTYHHSLMVANLAEQAAERIGANALLTRVGAYYHDVGKITRPYFYTENQAGEDNPHNQLEPRASAEVIMGHVDDGLKLAGRYRLPRRVRAFISGHHGTNRVSFFYNRALEQADDPTSVDESDFRYHGPNPQSKETALVMLADGCEAVVRAERPASAEELAKLVRDVIAQRRDSGLLADSNLTLGDLETAREALTSSLRGIFHPRIQYPRRADASDVSE
jgi:putative nucleotidyltransferase with HDIG domain